MPDTKDLFDRISNNYDLLNSLFSAGIDKIWRKKLVSVFNKDSFILDVATGTAEVLLEGFNLSRINTGLGIDPSIEMLKIGKDKLNNKGLKNKTQISSRCTWTLHCERHHSKTRIRKYDYYLLKCAYF